MSQRTLRFLILIVIVLALAVYFDLPVNHLGGKLETRLGLDLVGGVQALLEAEVPEGESITADDMRIATTIVENRVNGLGTDEAVVQQAGERRIVVELPGETDPQRALDRIKQTGLLEFVDMGSTPIPEGTIIQTDHPSTVSTSVTATDTVTSTVPTITDQIFHTVMTGHVIQDARVATDPNTGDYIVQFELTSDGSDEFADYTSSHVGQILGIVLDKRVVSAPSINSAITQGEGIIEGSFTYESALDLANFLRYGALPVPLKVVETRVVGPSLGQDSLQKSLVAGLIGFTIVILFMALYYRLPGLLADVAIIIYALIALALFRFIPITLTLAGIAGFLLSTGSALDANILIFERMKEELRAGRTLSNAVDLGWKRAWPSIRDSNIATLLTCAILFIFGSAFGATIVKGFSITLALGVMISLFTALVVTRTLMNLVLSFFTPENKARWFGI
jgi:preprotein translocase subunit SecD